MNEEASVKDYCDALRAQIKVAELSARQLKEHSTFRLADNFPGQHGEMLAQIMLAVRHLEDARMRLGKVVQYSQDGFSIFDRA